jgi:iron complex outermembrane recepter protein
MSTNSNLRTAVRAALGLGVGVFATMALVPAAMAQAPQQGQQAVMDEITVTGTRIRRADLESASPVTVVNRDDIVLTGLTDVGSFIQRMPSMSGSPIGTTTNNGGDGSVQIDLRGLGPARTLTLINGQRMVDGGDFQTVPQAMIERVEILKDGASAVYGADAVAGVVNIITRRDFEGLQFDMQTSDHFDMDSGRQNSFAMIAGTNFNTTHGRGNFVFGAEYVDQEEAYQSDAPWKFFQDSYYIYPEGCEKHPTRPYDGTPTGGCYPLGSSRIPEGLLFFATQGLYMNAGNGLEPWDGRTYNYAPVNYIQTPYERTNLFAETNFDLTPSIRFNSAIRANFRESAQELAPTPYTTEKFADPAHTVTVDGEQFQGVSADNFYLVQAVTAAGLIQEPLTQVRRRIVEQPRRFTQEVTQWQGVAGFEGDFRGMTWELSYNKGYRSQTDKDFGQFFGPALFNALGPSADLDGDGVPECYRDIADPSTIIPGCVPLNVFGGAGTITQEMLDYVGVNLVDSITTQQDVVTASLTGDAFELPAGPLGWAVGINYWDQSFDYSPDSAKQKGEATGNKGLGTDGSLYSTSYFGEFLAPVFDNGAQAVDIRGGVRLDDYNLFGSETTWQLGVEFRVIESVKLRGTAGTVFRAPTIGDLFGGQADTFPTYSDPCAVPAADLPAGCATTAAQPDRQALSRVGGNPDLKPETGDTFTAGVVWTPSVATGNLSLTLDYWKIDIDDGISSLGIQQILEDCYVGLNADACSLVTRNAGDYSVALVLDPTLNLTSQGAEGIDFEVRYAWDTRYGDFTASVLWAHMLERTKRAFPGSPKEDLSGRYTDPTAQDGGAYAEDKISYSLQWARGDLSVAYLGEYISSLDADTFCNCGPGSDPFYIQKIDSFLYHDLVASYNFTQTNTRITASITNITDEEPPFIEVGFNANTDPATYRMFGRGYWVRLEQKF